MEVMLIKVNTNVTFKLFDYLMTLRHGIITILMNLEKATLCQ